jgi:hypothetical protein
MNHFHGRLAERADKHLQQLRINCHGGMVAHGHRVNRNSVFGVRSVWPRIGLESFS